MCGICGFIGPGTSQDLQAMTAALAHRGPDAEGTWSDPAPAVYLGHRRLSVVDLAGGDQPMATADGDLVVIFNGEIYNHVELRRELEKAGHTFRTDHSDTEVLLQGYRVWGRLLPTRLQGMWAFALYDRRQRTLLASRDRFGKKPFFYTHLNGGFAFASELTSLRLHPAIRARTELSPIALRKYFGYGYIPAPHTIWRDIWKLPAGHSLWCEVDRPQEVRLQRDWRFEFAPEPIESERAAAQRAAEIREALRAAVERRLVADVPVGVFLSGGIDSSAVTALAAQQRDAGSVRTFSIGFEEPSFDESVFARQVAQHCGTRHFEERLSIEQARSLLPEIVQRLDEPMADSSLLPTSLLCRFARQQVTVALGGDGGDELFAGYDPFRALRLAERYTKLVPRPLHQAVAMLAARLPVSHRNMSFDFKLKRFLRGVQQPPAAWLPTWMAPLVPDELSELFQEPVSAEEVFSEAIALWDGSSHASPIDRATEFYLNLYLQDDILVKVDRASMAVGLEVRAPFLDTQVVELARRVPAEWRLRGGQGKYLLKRALEPLLPREIVHRTKKGFGMPVGAWLQRGVLTIERPALNPEFTHAKLAEHRAGRRDHRAFLWAVWLLSEWKGRHVG